MERVRCGAALLSLAASVGAMDAQAQAQRMVSVDLVRVSADIAQRKGLDESLMPLSILVPAQMASQVCGISPQALAARGQGAGCEAEVTSAELDDLVSSRMRADAAPPDTSRSGGPPAQ